MSETEGKTDSVLDCPNSGLPESECTCSVCSPMFLDFSEIFAECRDIIEVREKLEEVQQHMSHLDESGFDLEAEGARVRLFPPHVCHYYWAPCIGCGHPITVKIGKTPNDMFCPDCFKVYEEYNHENPQYYRHLFDYIMERCDLREEDGKTVWNCAHELTFAEEFCRRHGFSFERIRRRLTATGGYCDCEACFNSQFSLPAFHELPKEDSEND